MSIATTRMERRGLERLLHESAPEVERFLLDPVTALPTLSLLLPDVRSILAQGRSLGLLTVSISQFSKLEEIYGWESFDRIVKGVAYCLQRVRDRALRTADQLAELTVNGNVFVLLLAPPRTKRMLSRPDLARLKRRVTKKLQGFLEETLRPEVREQFGFFVGGGILRPASSPRVERLLYRTIDEALDEASTARGQALRLKARHLRSIVDRKVISTVYQPILDLSARRVVGYEALSRGPRGPYHRPDVMFKIAQETDLTSSLDRLCRDRAARGLRRLSKDQLLFVNVETSSVFDPALATTGPLARHNTRVVFEITERAAISDFPSFRQSGQLLKRSGFKLAVDDVGAGYAGLRVITEVDADFIKLDMQLTRDVDKSRVKLQLIRAIASFCAEARVSLIVEGVETPEELAALRGLGVHLVQGHLFGQPVDRPGAEDLVFPEPPTAATAV